MFGINNKYFVVGHNPITPREHRLWPFGAQKVEAHRRYTSPVAMFCPLVHKRAQTNRPRGERKEKRERDKGKRGDKGKREISAHLSGSFQKRAGTRGGGEETVQMGREKRKKGKSVQAHSNPQQVAVSTQPLQQFKFELDADQDMRVETDTCCPAHPHEGRRRCL